jgi:integrase
LPDSKTGKKPIYLSAAALAVLSTLPKAAGLDRLRIHDLRHSFASVGAGASLGLPVIGKLLGHSQAATTHRYAHLDADPVRRAAETIGSTIAAAMGNPSPNVVPMVKSR